MIHHLGELAPALLDGTHKNKTLVASGIVKGYTEALANIFSLLVEPPQAVLQQNAWPSLDQDEAFDPTTNLPK